MTGRRPSPPALGPALPPTIPLWQVALGTAFGVVIGKEVFGGTGMNFLNPALVTITGFYTDGTTNQTAAFLDFYLPIQKTTYSHQVRVGEEFYGLRLAAIIGNNQGVTMESMETDQTFDILMSSARR